VERYHLWDSPAGCLALVARGEKLVAVVFRDGHDQVLTTLRAEFPAARAGDGGVLDEGLRQLQEYFGGTRRSFSVEIDLAGCSAFTQRVLRELARVPYGEQISYGELATRCGSPRAARGVGRAMASNPLPLILPCHRVVGAGGKLTGYSGGSGLATKVWLLEFEAEHSAT